MAKPTAVKNTYAEPTPAQVKFAENLAIQAGYPRSYALSAARRDFHGKNKIGPMKRQECSEIIDFLKAKLDN